MDSPQYWIRSTANQPIGYCDQPRSTRRHPISTSFIHSHPFYAGTPLQLQSRDELKKVQIIRLSHRINSDIINDMESHSRRLVG